MPPESAMMAGLTARMYAWMARASESATLAEAGARAEPPAGRHDRSYRV